MAFVVVCMTADTTLAHCFFSDKTPFTLTAVISLKQIIIILMNYLHF